MSAQFRDVDQAVRWALQVGATLIVKTSSLARWRGAEPVPGDFTPQERHGQAAQIIKHLEALPTMELAFTLAKHMPTNWHAPLRSGSTFRKLTSTGGALPRRGPRNWDREECVGYLAAFCQEMAGDAERLEAYRVLVTQYLSGRKDPIRLLRAMLRIKTKEAMGRRTQAYRALDRLDIQCESRLYYALSSAGFLEGHAHWRRDFR